MEAYWEAGCIGSHLRITTSIQYCRAKFAVSKKLGLCGRRTVTADSGSIRGAVRNSSLLSQARQVVCLKILPNLSNLTQTRMHSVRLETPQLRVLTDEKTR